MNISKQVKKVGVVAAIGAASVLSSAGASAATMSFVGGDKVIDPSVDPTTFSLDLTIDGMLAASLGGGVSIGFNSSIINVTGVTFDNNWTACVLGCSATDNANAPGDYTTANTLGDLQLSVSTFTGVTTPTQGIATINFEVVAGATGTSTFTFDSIGAAGNWAYIPPVLPAGASSEIYCMTATATPAAEGCLDPDSTLRVGRELLLLQSSDVIVVGAVPVPAAVWLFGSGLIGLVGVSRRKVV